MTAELGNGTAQDKSVYMLSVLNTDELQLC